MLSEPEIIAYVEGTLSPEEQARAEEELTRNEALRKQVLDQSRLDAGLRAALGGAKADRKSVV